ncbi:MAG: hypothetical protein M1840_002193 [Geoglossum simile]|nr:MAG: hypothetical protein M1840_002193 [Geoglossum simile]
MSAQESSCVECVQRDEAQARIIQLQTANFHLNQHLRQTSLASQNDKGALKALQNRYNQLQEAHSKSEASRIWLEKKLHEERTRHLLELHREGLQHQTELHREHLQH